MALSQSVASELLEAFRAGEGVDLIRESVRLVMQELIETEATERVGAGRYERSESRVTDRNGSRTLGVRLVISDQHAGLVAALGRVFQGVGHQRCRVHFARNLLALV